MGKLTRGFLWAVFPPAGAVATVNHRAQQRTEAQTKKLLEAQRDPGRRAKEAEWNRRAGEVRKALKPFSRREKNERLDRIYNLFMYDGATLDQAITAGAQPRGAAPGSAAPQPR